MLRRHEELLTRTLVTAAVLTLAVEWLFPQHVAAAWKPAPSSISEPTEVVAPPPLQPLFFPESNLRPARLKAKVVVTAYSSTPEQTDDTPFITASGEVVHDGVVAANWLPFGVQLRIPGHFGDKVFTVQDRMHQRFSSRLDIWMVSEEEATAWGVKYLLIEVL